MSKTETKKTTTSKSSEPVYKNAEIHFIKAKVGYARVHEPQMEKGFKSEDGTQKPDKLIFKVDLIFDDNNRMKFVTLQSKYGIRNHVKLNKETGQSYMTFKRDAEVMADGKTISNYPKVVDKNNNPIPKTTLIGNGSECIVFYYLAPFGGSNPGHTVVFSAIQVLDLVPYVAPEREKIKYIEPDLDTATDAL